MFGVRNKIWNLQLANLAAKNQVNRSSISYKNAKHIGILGTIDIPEKIQIINYFVNNLELDGKTSTVLCYEKRKKPLNQIPAEFSYFTKKDISLFRAISAPQIKAFIDQEFDFLFHLDESPGILLTKIMAMSKAHCRVGSDEGINGDIYELMIKVQRPAPMEKFSDDMYHYAKILN